MKILSAISGNGRLYLPDNRADAAAFERDYGDDKKNLLRLEDKGAITLVSPQKKRRSGAAKPKGKTAPRRKRTTTK